MVASDFQYDWQLEAAKIQLLFDFRILRYYRRSLVRHLAPFADSVNKPLFRNGEFGEKEGAANI